MLEKILIPIAFIDIILLLILPLFSLYIQAFIFFFSIGLAPFIHRSGQDFYKNLDASVKKGRIHFNLKQKII